jgi:DNA-binding SARP family transcriptional activator/tetratricopeptide (TPR) repeat protein
MASSRRIANPAPKGRPKSRGGGKGIELFTLGGVRLVRDGTDETTKLGAKHLALMVYLFHENRPMHPAEVVELLGRGRDKKKDLEGLKRAVGWLGSNLPGVSVRITSETVEAVGGVRLDTRDVDSAIDASDAKCVADLYVGEFLDGFASGSPEFDEWAQKERGRIKRAWSHAILSAAREAERLAGWEAAAEWWEILVLHAPMRPEAVAGHLNSLAKSGREQDAARAFSEYVERLRGSGVAQPAEAVKKVVEQHKVLKEIADTQIIPVAPEMVPQQPPPAKEPSSSKQSAAGGEVAPDFLEGGEFARRDLGDLPQATVGDDLEVTFVEPKKGNAADKAPKSPPPQAAPPKPAPEQVAPPSPPPPEPAPKPPTPEPAAGDAGPDEEDPLKVAREAAAAFVDTQYGRVRHEVTGVRQSWVPALSRWWKELEPWRERMWDGTIAGLEWLGRAIATLPPLIAKAFVASKAGAAKAVTKLKRPKKSKRAKRSKAELAAVGSVEPADVAEATAVVEEPSVEESGSPAAEEAEQVEKPEGDLETKEAEAEEAEAAKATTEEADVEEDTAAPEIEETPAEEPADFGAPEPTLPVADPFGESTPTAELEEEPPVVDELEAEEPSVAELEAEGPAVAEPVDDELDAEEEEAAAVQPDEPGADPFGDAESSTQSDLESLAEAEFAEFAETFASQEFAMDDAAAPDETGEQPQSDGDFFGAVPAEDLSVPAPVFTASGAEDETGVAPDLPPWEAEAPATEPDVVGKTHERRRSALRRFWYLPVAAAVLVVGVVFGEEAISWVSSFTEELPERLNDVEAPSLPSVTIPRVTISAPSFVETSVSRIGEMLSGPLLDEPGEWVLVADVEVMAPPGPVTAEALVTSLELDLAQARFFRVVPRERALLARRQVLRNASNDLPLDDALALADVEGYALVLAAQLRHAEGNDSVAPTDSMFLRAFNSAGDTLYGVAAQVDSSAIATLAQLSRVVRDKMGEPEEQIQASKLPAQFLSRSPDAITAYHRARLELYAGRYGQAAIAAERAVSIDPDFALAYRLLAEAQALRGRITASRVALESAWRLYQNTTEREGMRILADWLAWEGRQTDAAVTYDKLFQQYRDDVGALKSQAVLQRAIGVRGGGAGNLRVAYGIDKYDWPRLDRIARFLGYTGTLPDVDSLIASLEESN